MKILTRFAFFGYLCHSPPRIHAVDPCDGQQEIPESTQFMQCPRHSHSCGSGIGHLWGFMKGCCCDVGRAYELNPGGYNSWLQTCQNCTWHSTSTVHSSIHGKFAFPDNTGYNSSGKNSTSDIMSNKHFRMQGGSACLYNTSYNRNGTAYYLPFWWTYLHIPPPCWIRHHLSWLLRFNLFPFMLRLGTFTVGGKLVQTCCGFDLCGSLFSLLAGGAKNDESTMLFPGALAFLEYQNTLPEVKALTLELINAHRAFHSNPLQTPFMSNPPVKITLVPADVKRMSWVQYARALGYPLAVAIISTLIHLCFWHLLQIFLFLLAFLSFYDEIDTHQLRFLSALMIREFLYVCNLCIGAYFKGAFLLYHPLAAWQASRRQVKAALLEICAYAFQPEKWVLKMAFVDNMRKPRIYYALITSAAALDLLGVAALVAGIDSGILPKPLLLCYILTIVSLFSFVLSVVSTDFFQEVVTSIDADFIAPLKHAGFTVGQLRRTGAPARELKKAGFTLEELFGGGFSVKDLRIAGFLGKDLFDAGVPFKELCLAGFTDRDLRSASAKALSDMVVSLEELRIASFSAWGLIDAGFSLDELRLVGVAFEQAAPFELKGAQGKWAATLNGIHITTGEMVGGRPAYRNGSGHWLTYCSEKGCWVGGQVDSSKGEYIGYLWGKGSGHLPQNVVEWKVHVAGPAEDAVFEMQAVSVEVVAVPFELKGAQGKWAAALNGIHVPTGEMIGGRLAYRNGSGHWLTYCSEKGCWVGGQTHSSKGTYIGHLWGTGSGHLPQNVVEWKVNVAGPAEDAVFEVQAVSVDMGIQR